MRGEPCPRRQRFAPGDNPERWNQQHQQPSDHAMIELHGGHVAEQVAPPWMEHEYSRWNQMAVHQRKSVVSKAGTDAGNKAAAQRHQENERNQHGREAAESATCSVVRKAWRSK